ncbi:MAG: hypothetical protein WD467_01005 [Candidatus Saccharimonadales bacterium]
MIPLLNKLKVSRSQRQLLRIVVSIGLAVAILFLIRSELLLFAVVLAVISKWQVVLGGPRLWLHNLWDNAVDIVVLWSFLALLVAYATDSVVQWALVAVYLLWQLLIKPLEGYTGRGTQSLFALALGIGTVFLYKGALGIAVMMLLGWGVGLVSAYHFLVGSDDSAVTLISFVWALIVAQLVWIFAQWLVLYPFFDGRIFIPQASLVVVALGYAFGNIYYDHRQKRLRKKRLYGYLGLMGLVIISLVVGSEWVAQL